MAVNRQPRRLIPITALLLVASVLLLWFGASCQGKPATTEPGSELLLAVLDVGQADSILVKSPAGRTMLIDAGNGRSDVEKVVLPFLRAQGITSLDYLVLTHPHQDHVGGMPTLLDSLPVSAFVDSVQPGITNQTYLQTLQAVQTKAIKPIKARRGQTDIDLGAGTEVKVLGPEDPLLETGDSTTNNNGVVLRLTYGSVSVFLAADIEQEAERRLLGRRDNLRSQILKVGHHGSRYSSSPEFLDAVNPEVALISAGAGNPYGHPHGQLLERLERRNLKTYRTDLHGTIQVLVDERGYRVITEKPGGQTP